MYLHWWCDVSCMVGTVCWFGVVLNWNNTIRSGLNSTNDNGPCWIERYPLAYFIRDAKLEAETVGLVLNTAPGNVSYSR